MSAKIITIAIEKGGTGKTVTASNLAYLMGDEGKKVLCVDTDPQGNLTKALSGGLMRDGRVRLKDCKSAKGKTYNATVLLGTEVDGRSKFSLEFEGGC